MTARTIRIATRASALALWQAHHIAERLRSAHDGLDVEIIELSTVGDRRTDVPLSVIGGKGVFVKEVQAAVLDGRADIAVHSAKDLPALTPEGLTIAAIPDRADPRDALVGCRLADLPEGATVATGSARRRTQLAELRPDLRFEDLRGNIDTRLGKLDTFDAIVMAAAALERLGRTPEVVDVLEPEVMLPQVGQAALAVECRDDDAELLSLLSVLDDADTRRCVTAERAFLERLGGDCDLPAGAFAQLDERGVWLRGVLVDPVNGTVHRAELAGEDPVEIGDSVAVELTRLIELG